ncbi:NAD-dependent epimerase/dehydratase family protein (plasmid) [Sphingomonas paeninsulae]|uniref:NAD-dependent epimerase/dehydratase family protein n=1 Tax=Sphingomonas paeninsulae TaxID=2319844 RepID=A0A494THK2_SPHPE|nr:NAD-dependent epimerase/dehydratase family protein [Sphingomonas paeninsulae]AYJ85291.1 NAD-dependent epimerase/dehydratase family protein [Sphingomonas paeninsulae]
MRVFMIGATGYIGSHVARKLAANGHEIIGFARSDAAAAKVSAEGYQPFVGDIAATEDLIHVARSADATIFAAQLTLEEEYRTIGALIEGYRNSGKTLIMTSGTGVLGQRTKGIWSEDSFAEDDPIDPPRSIAMRVESENLVRASVAIGVRGIVARPPMVWGDGQSPHIELIVQSVLKTGSACYIGTGLNLYSNVNVYDLAKLYSQIVDKGVAGALYHAVGGELNNRCMAEFVGRRLGCETRSITMDEAIELWGKFAAVIVMGASSRSRSPRSRAELGWQAERPDIIDYILDDPMACNNRSAKIPD